MSWCVEYISKILTYPSNLNLSNTKMPTLPTLCITGKLELKHNFWALVQEKAENDKKGLDSLRFSNNERIVTRDSKI